MTMDGAGHSTEGHVQSALSVWIIKKHVNEKVVSSRSSRTPLVTGLLVSRPTITNSVAQQHGPCHYSSYGWSTQCPMRWQNGLP